MSTLNKWDLNFINMTEEQLKDLPDYSCSRPSGVYPGKIWKRNLNFGTNDPDKWIVCTYEVEPDQETYPNMVKNGYYTPLVGTAKADLYKNRGGATCWKNIVPPEGTPYD